MISLGIGYSGLNAAQRALDTTGHNLANASTAGYHRQEVELAASEPLRFGTLELGAGVDITGIRRLKSYFLDAAVHAQAGATSDGAAQLDSLRQVESLLSQGPTTLSDLFGKFFQSVQDLAARPTESTLRTAVLTSATAITDRFHELSTGLTAVGQEATRTLKDDVDRVNAISSEIADLNNQITAVALRGASANDLADRRDLLVDELAGLLNVRTVAGANGQTTVIAAGVPLVVGAQAMKLQLDADADGSYRLTAAGSTAPLPVQGGAIAGLMDVLDNHLPTIQGDLDRLAASFAESIDRVQATGLSAAGGNTFLSGQRAVKDASVPLAQAGLPFPVEAGSLFVSVTNVATGARTLQEVAFDPNTQSLQDLATALDALPGLQAGVDPQTKGLQLIADAGYTFDFAGRVQPSPEAAAITGSARPSVEGAYSGATNDAWTFRVVGSGTVGTGTLRIDVTDASGGAVGSYNVGAGYTAGGTLTLGSGVRLKLGAGTLNDGDTFSSQLVAEPDETGALAGLGVGTFFVGGTARDLAVRPDLLQDGRGLAASRTGAVGDVLNLQRLLDAQDALGESGETLQESAVTLTGGVATRVNALTLKQEGNEATGQALEAQRQGVSGVDPNEEMVRMLQFQRAFESSARFLSVVNSTLDELMRII